MVIEPTQENIPLDTPNNTPEFSQISKGEVRTFIEPYTRVLLLQKSSEDLLAEMKQKGRYNIRLAEKNGCDVRRVSPTPEMLDIFMELLEETLERDGFSGNSRKYYESLLQSMNNPAEGMYAVFFESRAIAAAIMTIT